MGDEEGRDPKEERGALWLTLGHPCSILGRMEKEGVFCYFSDLLPRLSKPWELGRWSQLGGLEEKALEDGACWSPPLFHPGLELRMWGAPGSRVLR